MIRTLLSKYAVRKTPEEESVLVLELLNQDSEDLKAAIKVGRELGYTDKQLMPLIGAYGLINYRFKEGVSKDATDAIGVSKNTIDNYIVRTGMYARDRETRDKIWRRVLT